MWLAIVSLAANPVLVLPAETERPAAGALSDLTSAQLDTLCSANGGLAGPFGEGQIEAEIADSTSWSEPTWKLDKPVGPFVMFERWSEGQSNAAVTLRYEGFTSPQFDDEKLASRLLQITKVSDWAAPAPVTTDGFSQNLARRYFYKWVKTGGEDVRLWVHADGGLETTSLYCFREDLRKPAFVKLEEEAGLAADIAE